MRAIRTVVPSVIVLAMSTACAGRRADPNSELAGRASPCIGTTVAVVTNSSTALFDVVAWSGARQLNLGTAVSGLTSFSTNERVDRVSLVQLVEPPPVRSKVGRAPGNFSAPDERPQAYQGSVRIDLKCELRDT
jgi:hypothetical protein